MSDLEIVTTSDRPDLEDETRAAFRQNWPEFIFHDPVSREHIGRVESYFPFYDVLLLDGGEVAAGGWGVPMQWDGTVAGLPAGGYDGALVASVNGHEASLPRDTLCIMAAAVRRGPAPDSMIIKGTVAEWEEWAAMAFPESGRYVVPDALDLVDVDREADRGVYSETNLWMRHL
jgi:hypothetical protein